MCLKASITYADNKIDTTKTYNIPELTVTEQYKPANTRSSVPVQILSQQQIQNASAIQISDVVKLFSGVNVKDYGGIGGLKTVSVRSLGAEHTAVSYDGITINDCQTGQIDIGRFSLENVTSIALSNGQSEDIFIPARLYASAAILSIKTGVPLFLDGKNIQGKMGVKAGSFGLFNPYFLIQKQINSKYTFTFNGEYATATGAYPYLLKYSYLDDGLTSNETRKNSDTKNLRFESALYANFSDKANGYLKAYYYKSDRGLPGATIFYNEDIFTSQRLKDNTFFTQAHFQHNISSNITFQANAKYNRGYINYVDSATLNTEGYQQSIYTQNEFYGSVSALFRLKRGFTFNYSTDVFVNNMFAQYENNVLTNQFARPVRYSFLNALAAKYTNNRIHITGSILSTVVNDVTMINDSKNNWYKFSPFLSANYKPFQDTDLRFRLFYKNIFRLPTFNDLYYTRIGNADLKPETTNQFNAGITFSSKNTSKVPTISFTIDGYRNNVVNKIVAMPVKNIFLWSMTNLGKVQITGVDVNMETAYSFSKNIRIRAGGAYTYQQALDVTNVNGDSYIHQIPYTPRVSGSGNINIETSWINLAYTVIWSGARYAGYQNYAELRLNGYSDQSISVYRNFQIKKSDLNVKAEILNLSNTNYEIVRYYPMPGRSWRISLTYKF